MDRIAYICLSVWWYSNMESIWLPICNNLHQHKHFLGKIWRRLNRRQVGKYFRTHPSPQIQGKPLKLAENINQKSHCASMTWKTDAYQCPWEHWKLVHWVVFNLVLSNVWLAPLACQNNSLLIHYWKYQKCLLPVPTQAYQLSHIAREDHASRGILTLTCAGVDFSRTNCNPEHWKRRNSNTN